MLGNWQLTQKFDYLKHALTLVALGILLITLGHWLSILFAPSPLPVPPHVLPQSTSQSLYREAQTLFIGHSDLNSTLSLKGVIVGNHHNGIAVISLNHGLPHPYREGGEIISGMTLVQVTENQAIIRREGHEETLNLPTSPKVNGLRIEH